MTTLPTRVIEACGLRMSEIGFGASTLGNLHRAMTDDDAHAAVRHAWHRGVRYFDTAPHYGLGLSERRLGRALAEYPRAAFVVSTKVGRLLEPNPEPTALDDDGFVVPGDLRRVWDFSADGVRRSLDGSLTRLGLDHVDIVYAHDPDQFRAGAAREALEALAELRSQGVVRAIGVGTNAPDKIPDLFTSGLPDVVMVAGRYTLLEQGVAAGDHDDVGQPAGEQVGDLVRGVGPHADRAHHALRAQLRQGLERLAGCARSELVGVVGVHDVDVVEPEPGQRAVEGAAHAVGGEVPDPPQVAGDHEAVVVEGGRLGVRFEQAAHLRRHDERRPRVLGERATEASLGQAQAVVRSGVEVPDPAVPGVPDGGVRVVVRHRPVQVAERRGAEPDLGHPQSAGFDDSGGQRRHVSP